MGGEREGPKTAGHHGEQSEHRDEHPPEARGDFLAPGPIPPVSTRYGSPGPTASELAFGPHNAYCEPGEPVAFPPSDADKHADQVRRIEIAYDMAQDAGVTILTALVPAYLKARDALDVSAVAEIGGRIVGGFSVVHGAKSALDHLLPRTKQTSVAGGTIEQALELAKIQQAVDAKLPFLASLIPTVDDSVASALTPHMYRGQEVAGVPVIVSLEGLPNQRRGLRLGAELERTIGMIGLVDEMKGLLFNNPKTVDKGTLESARRMIQPWASRPLDLAFLRAALGPIWDLLDATATSDVLGAAKPSDLLDAATKQTKHTGWLGDLGRVDMDAVITFLKLGGRESAEAVLMQLYTADPDARAMLLMQIKERKLLPALCDSLGWAPIKELHDSLGVGYPEIKTDLQKYFIGPRKFGPSLDSEWENHDYSFRSLIANNLGTFGDGLNHVLDFTTFGFHSSYGNAVDENSRGYTSEGEYRNAKMHAAARTAAVLAVALVTGGMADKFVRGGAGAVSGWRAAGAGMAAGVVGSTTGLVASDTYGVAMELQEGFSSPEDYVKTAVLGGLIGAGFGRLSNGFSPRTASYLPRGAAPVEGEAGVSAAGGGKPLVEPEVATGTAPKSGEPVIEGPSAAPAQTRATVAANKAGIDPATLTVPQRELIAAAETAMTTGDVHGAIAIFDDLVASGVPRPQVAALEASMAEITGTTSPQVYRDPKAVLPSGKPVEPSAYGGRLFYGTSGPGPEVVFEQGLAARGHNIDLHQHTMQAADSAFRGTTKHIFDPRGVEGHSGAGEWAGEGGWVYKIDGTPSWDLNAALEGKVPRPDGSPGSNQMRGEQEHAILANVPRERIVGAQRIVEHNGRLRPEPMIPNPNYKPPR